MTSNNYIKEYQQSVLHHYSSVWGINFKHKKWSNGPIVEAVPHFSVLEYKPCLNRKMWTYATCGMSAQTDLFPIELHIFSSVQDESLVELLSIICYYHNVEAKLGLGHTVDFGRPWQNSSTSTFGLVSLPYLDGPKLEIMPWKDNKDIHFYWLIPITKAEVRYKKEVGLEALESKLETDGFNYIDPYRNSVV